MFLTNQLVSIYIMVVSFLVPLLVLYVYIDGNKQTKKAHIDDILNVIIYFILLLWVGKILWNIPMLVHNPMAVLSYPSGANAFYLAMLGSSVILFYKYRFKDFDIQKLLYQFLGVFLLASFIYKDIYFIWLDEKHVFTHIILLLVCLVFYVFLHKNLKTIDLICLILAIYITCLMVILFLQGFVLVFGYSLDLWMLVLSLLLVIVCRIRIFSQSRRVKE